MARNEQAGLSNSTAGAGVATAKKTIANLQEATVKR
jgi:hypothetical protein